jgi:hypothetical protein
MGSWDRASLVLVALRAITQAVGQDSSACVTAKYPSQNETKSI